jgi:hypothetical protein
MHETTLTEWELKDINGDGYPDVVFNSSPVVHTTEMMPFPDDPADFQKFNQATLSSQDLAAGSDNRVEAVLNVLGARLTDGNDQPFSAPVVLIDQDHCGVDMWSSGSATSYRYSNHICGFEDINGDGIVDRFSNTSVFLGMGGTATTGLFTPGSVMTLPGPLAIHQNLQVMGCAPPATAATTFSASALAAVRDVTGDGIPDYLSSDVNGNWTARIGTGASFATPLPIVGSFKLSAELEDCGGTTSTTTDGMFDVDGDGKADVVTNGQVWMLSGPSNAPGMPDAGRLVRIDNGFGAQTNVHYRSTKADAGVLHQIPFPEIVVDSVATSGANSLGGDLLPTRFAYGGAELLYDPAIDAFTFRGYRRMVELPTPVSQAAGVATFTITDNYAPVSAVDPYGVMGAVVLDSTQRYNLYLRTGRISDITTLSGNFGTAALGAPNQLLTIDVGNDARRVAAVHFDWNARFLGLASDPPGVEPCSEMVSPYDYAASTAYASNHVTYDACTAHGFAYGSGTQSWRGEPGAAPPALANVESRTEIRGIDLFGRVTNIAYRNDLHRDDDDICIETTYAAAAGSNERVLFAPSFRTVSGCDTTIYAKESWEYDGLPSSTVSAGLVTAHSIERRDDAGVLLSTIRQFDATYDTAGNPSTITTTRDDGATRTASATHDSFGLAPVTVTVMSPTAPTLQTTFDRDFVTLNAIATTDPNGTQHGVTLDGFERPVLSTMTPPGGAKACCRRQPIWASSETALSGVAFRERCSRIPLCRAPKTPHRGAPARCSSTSLAVRVARSSRWVQTTRTRRLSSALVFMTASDESSMSRIHTPLHQDRRLRRPMERRISSMLMELRRVWFAVRGCSPTPALPTRLTRSFRPASAAHSRTTRR